MAVAQVGTIAKGGAASGASPQTVTLPNTATAGNVLIVAVAGSASGTRTFSTPAGWTALNSGTAAGTSAGMLAVFGFVASGGETSVSVAWTGGNMVFGYRAIELSGIDSVSPFAGPAAPNAVTTTSAGPSTLTAATRTSATAGEYLLSFLGGRGPAAGLTHAWDGAETETDTGVTGQVAVCYSAFQVIAASGGTATPSSTYTNTMGSPVTIIEWVAIKPAAAATAAPAKSLINTFAAVNRAGSY